MVEEKGSTFFGPNPQVVRAVCGMWDVHFQLIGSMERDRNAGDNTVFSGSEGRSCICIPRKTTRSLQQTIVRFPVEEALLAPVVSVVCFVVHDEFVVHKVEAV